MDAKPLISGQIWGKLNAGASKGLSNVLNFGAVALLVPELFADLSNNVKNGKIWPLTTSGNLTFDIAYKLPK